MLLISYERIRATFNPLLIFLTFSLRNNFSVALFGLTNFFSKRQELEMIRRAQEAVDIITP